MKGANSVASHQLPVTPTFLSTCIPTYLFPPAHCLLPIACFSASSASSVVKSTICVNPRNLRFPFGATLDNFGVTWAHVGNVWAQLGNTILPKNRIFSLISKFYPKKKKSVTICGNPLWQKNKSESKCNLLYETDNLQTRIYNRRQDGIIIGNNLSGFVVIGRLRNYYYCQIHAFVDE